MIPARIADLVELLQAEHPTWAPDERQLGVWTHVLGALPWPTLEAAGRRYLANEAGRPQLAKFLKYLPPGAAARARGEPGESSSAFERTREDTFGTILASCLFDGQQLASPYRSQSWHVDAYQAWRREGRGVLAPPPSWREPHHTPATLLAFLDRFAGISSSGATVIELEIPFDAPSQE
jgi:hypothetical protein